MAISIHKPKWIPLLFSLGIGIPCLLLGYLAFRGIRNDQALLEKERLNEHRKILELVNKSVEENISKAEQAFLYFITENKEVNQSNLLRSMVSLKNQNPLVEEVFFSEDSGEIHLPIAKLLFLPNGSTISISAPYQTPASVRKERSSQQLEFQEKNYQKAIEDYETESGYPDELLLSALHSIASIYIKLNEYDEAKKYIEQMHKLPEHGNQLAQELLDEIKEKERTAP